MLSEPRISKHSWLKIVCTRQIRDDRYSRERDGSSIVESLPADGSESSGKRPKSSYEDLEKQRGRKRDDYIFQFAGQQLESRNVAFDINLRFGYCRERTAYFDPL